MGLGERCDEIVALIDETLAAFDVVPAETPPTPGAPVATATLLTVGATTSPPIRRRLLTTAPSSPLQGVHRKPTG